jgi:ornithine carbamoyltransferase
MKDFTSLKTVSKQSLLDLIQLALEIKKNPQYYRQSLADKKVGLLFEKPSLRTKTAFYLGASILGAHVVYYSHHEVQLGKREEVSDVARTLSSYLDAVVLRTFSHQTITEFSNCNKLAVINGLSDLFHPSQILGDFITLQERGVDFSDIKICYLGDGNNVCHSLLYGCAILGVKLSIASLPKYRPNPAVVKDCVENYKLDLNVSDDPQLAIKGADVVYTDVWTSMGDEPEQKQRRKDFKKFCLDDKLLSLAHKNSLVMHCLPAHRGEEITDSVIDGEHSIVWQQAGNRLYSACALLHTLLGGKK